MGERAGRWVPLSLPRRMVNDLMRHCRHVPTVIAERRFRLGALVAARRTWPQRPSWAGMFLKAFAKVAENMPPLRRAYLPYPWPHLYEHPTSTASLTVERELDGEEAVFIAQFPRPDQCSLCDLDRRIRGAKELPPHSIAPMRRALRIARLPAPLRRLLWWIGLYWSGRERARHFGTFGLTSPAAAGAGMQQVLTILTSTLHYGLLDSAGDLDMRLTFDHRVYDGATAARALTAMEEVLHAEILSELRAGPQAAQDAVTQPSCFSLEEHFENHPAFP